MSYFVYFYLLGVTAFVFLPLVKGGKSLTPFGLFGLIGLVFWLLFIRDPIAASDGYNYTQLYVSIKSLEDVFDAYHNNYLFSLIQWGIKQFDFSAPSSVKIISMVSWTIIVIGFGVMAAGRHRELLLTLGLFCVTSTFILLYFNALRQGLALSLLILTIGLVKSGRCWAGGIFGIFSVMAHTSAMMAAPLCLLPAWTTARKILISKSGAILVVALGVVTAGVLKFGLPIIWEFFGSNQGVDDYPEFSVLGLVAKIYDLQLHEAGNELVVAKLTLGVTLVFFFLFMLGRIECREEREGSEFLVSTYILLVSISIALSAFPEVSGRLIYYSSALIPVLFARLFFVHTPFCNSSFKGMIYVISVWSYGLLVILYPATAKQMGI